MSILSTITGIITTSGILGGVLLLLKKFMDFSGKDTDKNTTPTSVGELAINHIKQQQAKQVEVINKAEVAQVKVEETINTTIKEKTEEIKQAATNTFVETEKVVNDSWDKL